MNNLHLKNEFIEWMSTEGLSSGNSYASYISSFFKIYKTFTLEDAQVEALIDNGDIEELNEYFSHIYTIINFEKNSKNALMSLKELRDASSALKKYHLFLGELLRNSNTSQENVVEFDDDKIETFKVDDIVPLKNVKKIFITADELKANFTNRLLSQDRLYGDIFFPISLIKKICYKNNARQEFDFWMESQLNKIKFHTNLNTVFFNDFESLRINENGEVLIDCKDNISRSLYTKLWSNDNATKMFVNHLKQIVIDHEIPMKELLIRHKENLTALKTLTNELKEVHKNKYRNRKDLNIAGNKIISSRLFNPAEIKLLINDINFINDKTSLQMMESTQNSIKRAN